MAAATKKGLPPGRVVRRSVSGSATEFLVLEDDGGRFHWAIVDAAGESVGQSGSFASRDDAESAARVARDTAGMARLEGRAPDDPPRTT
jgi:uncharacterized protein YegP (UPF0339 family)